MPFKISHKDLLLPMLASFRTAWPLWLSLTLGLALVVAGCLADVRMLVLGLMMWLAVTPMVAFMLYFSKALSPNVVPNLVPHTLHRLVSGYEMRLYRLKEDEDPGDEEPEDEAAPRWERTSILRVADKDVVREQTLGAYRVLYLSAKSLSILYLPLTPTPDYENP